MGGEDGLPAEDFTPLQRIRRLLIGRQDPELLLGGEGTVFGDRANLIAGSLLGILVHRELPSLRPPHSIFFSRLVSLHVDTEGNATLGALP